MNTTLLPTLVEEIEEGDVVEFFNNDRRLVVDFRENGYMNGCWLECADGSTLFYEYGNKVNLVVDA
jgi:hypothetical protein